LAVEPYSDRENLNVESWDGERESLLNIRMKRGEADVAR
jgi:hypothetical protein